MRRFEGESSSYEAKIKPEKQSHQGMGDTDQGVQRLASRLQPVYNTGSASLTVLREVNKQLSSNLSYLTSATLLRMDYILNGTKDLSLKEKR